MSEQSVREIVVQLNCVGAQSLALAKAQDYERLGQLNTDKIALLQQLAAYPLSSLVPETKQLVSQTLTELDSIDAEVETIILSMRKTIKDKLTTMQKNKKGIAAYSQVGAKGDYGKFK
jgi:hypothetical protein